MHRFGNAISLCALALLAACAGQPAKPQAAVTAVPVSAAPAAAARADISDDSATPIPDINDGTPVIQWGDINLSQAAPKYDDLWQYLGANFSLPKDGSDGRVQGELTWFAAHGEYLQRVAGRARPYLYYIVQQVQARKMPLDVALLPVVESAFDPFAYSYGRAAGLWQFVPGTGRMYELKQDWWYDGRRDVAASTNAALDYLQFLHDQFNGDWLLALAAYNSGSGTVTHAIARNQRHGLPTDFWHLDLPAETRAYVPRLLAICQLVADPQHLGVDLTPVSNSPYLTQVDTGGQIDLETAAKLAGISGEQIYMLNPGYNRWATDPEGPYKLFVPLEDKDVFEQALAQLPPHDRVQWASHKVRSGDTIGGIANDYHTTLAVLRQLNGLHGNLLHVNQMLLVPVARQTLADSTLHREARVAGMQDQHMGGGRIVHKVRNGETLWVIARRYHVSVDSLRRWNKLGHSHVLRQGQKLVIWRGQAKASDEA
jgi:membrane-bound lytic murein transglycosylase D